VCLARGVDAGAVVQGLRSFKGVPHRLERIAVIDGVTWINDSKATNVESTLVALRAVAAPGRVWLIAGGRGKAQDFTPLAPLVAEKCAAVYLIGEAAEEIGRALTGVPLHPVGDLEHAVAAARAAAGSGDVVLLSPACASFDQYRDFEARGEHFRALVNGLR
jgi:UDP-N-acetylmuramoylalanine--D-glutamate ligase